MVDLFGVDGIAQGDGYKAYDLTELRRKVFEELRFAGEQSPMTPTDLAEALDVDRAVIVKALDNLHKYIPSKWILLRTPSARRTSDAHQYALAERS